MLFFLTALVLQQPDTVVLVDFSRETAANWFVVNDGVMGGVSSSRIEIADDIGVFAGYLSLANNGGFASVRTDVSEFDLSGHEALVLRVRGDGRTYQLRLRTTRQFDGIAYSAAFDTERGQWISVTLPFSEFTPTFRGYTPRDAPPMNPGAIRQLGLLIGDKREGEVRLEVESVVSVKQVRPQQ